MEIASKIGLSIADRLEASLLNKQGTPDQGSESPNEDLENSDDSDPLEEAVYLYEEASRMINDSSGSEGDICKLLACCVGILTSGSESECNGNDSDKTLAVGCGGATGTVASAKSNGTKRTAMRGDDDDDDGREKGDNEMLEQLPSAWRHVLSEALVLHGKVVEWRAPQDAAAMFRRAVAASPLNAEAHLQVGRRLYLRSASGSNDLSGAEASIREAIRLAEAEQLQLQNGGDDEGGVEKEEDEGGSECGGSEEQSDDDEAAAASFKKVGGKSDEGEDDGSAYEDNGGGEVVDEDDEDNDDDEEDEEDDDDTGPEANRILARLLSQCPGRKKEAHELLVRMGYTHALAHDLTSFDFLRPQAPASASSSSSSSSFSFSPSSFLASSTSPSSSSALFKHSASGSGSNTTIKETTFLVDFGGEHGGGSDEVDGGGNGAPVGNEKRNKIKRSAAVAASAAAAAAAAADVKEVAAKRSKKSQSSERASRDTAASVADAALTGFSTAHPRSLPPDDNDGGVDSGCADVDEDGDAVSGGVDGPIVSAYDGALPPHMAAHLLNALAHPKAAFWSEHDYGSPNTGYFSYQIKLPSWGGQQQQTTAMGASSSTSAPSSLEAVLLHLRAVAQLQVPTVRECDFAEFWAHSRPHSSGHKMHFDYVEQNGVVRHPEVSTVLYLTNPCGGPTLVTDQRMKKDEETTDDKDDPDNEEQCKESTERREKEEDEDGEKGEGGAEGSEGECDEAFAASERGFVVVPKSNRLLVFRGQYLHCVLPGVGVGPPPCRTSPSSSPLLHHQQKQEANKHNGDDDRGLKDVDTRDDNDDDFDANDFDANDEAPRRVTFMVAFWREDPKAPQFPHQLSTAEATSTSLTQKSGINFSGKEVQTGTASDSSLSGFPRWPRDLTAPFEDVSKEGGDYFDAATTATTDIAAGVGAGGRDADTQAVKKWSVTSAPVNVVPKIWERLLGNDDNAHDDEAGNINERGDSGCSDGGGENDKVQRGVHASSVGAVTDITDGNVSGNGNGGKKSNAILLQKKVLCDLLSDGCFTNFGALNSGLVLARDCSLNCGGTCAACILAASKAEKME